MIPRPYFGGPLSEALPDLGVGHRIQILAPGAYPLPARAMAGTQPQIRRKSIDAPGRLI
jgi:hypothetical protein